LRPSFGLTGLERGSPRVTGKAPPTGVRVGCGEGLGWERGTRTAPRRLLSAGRDGREFRSRRRGCVWRRRPLSEHLDGPVAIASHGVPVDHLDAEIPANEADLVDHAGAATTAPEPSGAWNRTGREGNVLLAAPFVPERAFVRQGGGMGLELLGSDLCDVVRPVRRRRCPTHMYAALEGGDGVEDGGFDVSTSVVAFENRISSEMPIITAAVSPVTTLKPIQTSSEAVRLDRSRLSLHLGAVAYPMKVTPFNLP
jgi:hypothetical protein